MHRGDVYKTPTGQHRFVLGQTRSGEIAFATRGNDVLPDYGQCQIQTQDVFNQECSFVKTSAAEETARVAKKFENYIAANQVT